MIKFVTKPAGQLVGENAYNCSSVQMPISISLFSGTLLRCTASIFLYCTMPSITPKNPNCATKQNSTLSVCFLTHLWRTQYPIQMPLKVCLLAHFGVIYSLQIQAIYFS